MLGCWMKQLPYFSSRDKTRWSRVMQLNVHGFFQHITWIQQPEKSQPVYYSREWRSKHGNSYLPPFCDFEPSGRCPGVFVLSPGSAMTCSVYLDSLGSAVVPIITMLAVQMTSDLHKHAGDAPKTELGCANGRIADQRQRILPLPEMAHCNNGEGEKKNQSLARVTRKARLKNTVLVSSVANRSPTPM